MKPMGEVKVLMRLRSLGNTRVTRTATGALTVGVFALLLTAGACPAILASNGVSSDCSSFAQSGSSTASAGSSPNWVPVALATCPPARSNAAAASFPAAGGGTDVLLVGGGDYSNAPLGDEWVWNGITWSELPSNGTRPPALAGPAMAYDSTHHEVVLYAGSLAPSANLYDVWTFDPTTQTWTKHAEPSGAGAAGTWPELLTASIGLADDPADGGVLAWGQTLNGLIHTWLWNGSTWTNKAPAHQPPDGFGNMNVDPSSHSPMVLTAGAATWRWQGGDWVVLSPSHSPPTDLARLTGFGGPQAGVLWVGSASTWLWNGTDWSRITTLASPEDRSYDTYKTVMAAFETSATSPIDVVLFGGITKTTMKFVNDTWVYSIPTNVPSSGGGAGSWSQQNPSTPSTNPGGTTGHAGGASAYDAVDHQVVAFGGYTGGGGVTGDTWTWDGTTWTDHPAGAGTPPARAGAVMATDPSGHVVMFGGNDGTSNLDDTWTWSAGTWTHDATANPPTGRTDAAMALLGGSGTDILFGGGELSTPNSNFGDTWAWNGSNWTPVTTSGTLPPARADEGLAYDIITGKLVMFGGNDGSGSPTSTLDDTWTYSSGTWTPVTTDPNTPDPLQNMAMVSDPADDGGVLLFGGLSTNTTVERKTWHWNGTGWSQPSSTTAVGATVPPARFNAFAADDVGRAQVVLSDGLSSSFAYLSDTWLWHS
jgi:hypothetical protein